MPQSLTQLNTHIIYSTKDQIGFLRDPGIRKELHAYIASILKTYESIPIIVGGVEDHMHILCIVSQKYALSKIVGETKRTSSKWIKTKGKQYTSFFWQRGFGGFSVSNSQVGNVRRYIENQQNHHKKRTFREEYLEFMRKHNIPFDVRYIWDREMKHDS
jgi:putative transposase